MQFDASEVEANNKRSRNAMKTFRRHAQRTLRSVRINLRSGAKSVCRNGKSLELPSAILCNFEYAW